MTEVAIPEPMREIAPSSLHAWANDARQAATVAVSLAKTPFVPQSLRGATPDITAANITAVILTGQELNLQPMASLRSIDIIQGTPAMRANTMRGLVQSHGHEVWVEISTATRAIVKGRRKGEEHIQESKWDMDRAKGLGLVSKDNWRKQPTAMLIARATSELCRLVASDVLLGVPYSVEELTDLDASDIEKPTPAPKRTARRQQIEAAEPAFDPGAPAPTEATPSPDEPAGPVVASGDQAEVMWPEPPADWEPQP